MNGHEVRAKQIQQMRRCVLSILLEAYGHCPLTGDSIYELLLEQYPDTTEEDLKKDLTYLAAPDKGYVEVHGPTRGVPWGQRLYSLTGKGNEVANRMERDPALGI